jgi:hypothetical protein
MIKPDISKTYKILMLVFVIIAFLILLRIPQYIFRSEEQEAFKTYRVISIGMATEDLETAAGKPDFVIDKKQYLEIMDNCRKDNFYYGKLKLPIKNKVYIYTIKGNELYVFIGEANSVESVFWGHSGLRPMWAKF